ncbi:DUF1064 domain-containing protein [Devosia sp.]|uniref:DUF1064 domain-containing protein n=1 Tax=Devosia sp. TaxID=1871048 RepID=UPI002732604B|nr:DUF1064 domain-containing protein [Devosia sp.]MDP2779757.1 DUF1064 domain-containing protein [Devosia sp.]
MTEEMDVAELRGRHGVPSSRFKQGGRPKYLNRKLLVEGEVWHSEGEYKRWCDLVIEQRAGNISSLRHAVPFVVFDGFRDRKGKWQRKIVYIADYYYFDEVTHEWVAEDHKGGVGAITAAFKIKQKLFLWRYPESDFRIHGAEERPRRVSGKKGAHFG